jgi:hypothetical protein
MIQSKNFASAFGLATMMVLLVLALSVPSSGGAASTGNVTYQPSTGARVPGQVDCGQAAQALDTPTFELPEGGSCKADLIPGTVPSWTPVAGGRTCRCSCGYPCKTDADCGGAVGSCRGGISCC